MNDYHKATLDKKKTGFLIRDAIIDRLLDPLAMYLFENKDDLRAMRGMRIIAKATKEGFRFEFGE